MRSERGLRQSFDVEPLPVMATPAIYGVQLTMLARKTDAGLGKVKGLVVEWCAKRRQHRHHPAGAAGVAEHTVRAQPNGNVQWTGAAFNAAEFGVESAHDGSRRRSRHCGGFQQADSGKRTTSVPE